MNVFQLVWWSWQAELPGYGEIRLVISDGGSNGQYFVEGLLCTPMLGASNASSATLAIVFQYTSLVVAWWPETAGFLVWFPWPYIQSTLACSHPNFIIVFSSSQSLTFENIMHGCWYWYSKLLKVQWFKIAQRWYADGSGSQRSKTGLTRRKCL